MRPKIFVSTFPFARTNSAPLEILQKSGFDIVLNPEGKKISGEALMKYASDCDGIIAGTEDLTPVIQRNQRLKIISRVGIGLDSLPLKLCEEKGITITYTPDAVSYAVAELTLGLMISLTRKIQLADSDLRHGGWSRFQGKGLNESVIGIIGFGRIGKLVAQMLRPFSPVNILVNDILPVDLSSFSGQSIQSATKEEIYRNADILTLHVPMNSRNLNMINAEVFSVLKDSSFLINTSRGGLIDEMVLAKALREGRLQGAGLDVFSLEPYTGELITLPNVILTQHMGSCSDKARLDMELGAAEDIVRFFRGEKLVGKVPPELMKED